MRGLLSMSVGLVIWIVPPLLLFNHAGRSLLLVMSVPASALASLFAGIAVGMFVYSRLSKHKQ
jgi:hypothetical protein